MHQLVVAQGRPEEVLEAIGRLTVPFAELPSGRNVTLRRQDGEPVLVGAVNGLTYLSEVYGTVFAMCGGLLARVARALDALVIGSAFDPGEEHCEFFVARGVEVVRVFWSNPRRTTRPYSQGRPLPCEAECPLSAAGGVGLELALRAFGFSFPEPSATALLPGERWVTWPGNSLELMEADERAAAVNDHVRAYWNPAYSMPVPTVRVRRVEKGSV
jgi:hypothetical protein